MPLPARELPPHIRQRIIARLAARIGEPACRALLSQLGEEGLVDRLIQEATRASQQPLPPQTPPTSWLAEWGPLLLVLSITGLVGSALFAFFKTDDPLGQRLVVGFGAGVLLGMMAMPLITPVIAFFVEIVEQGSAMTANMARQETMRKMNLQMHVRVECPLCGETVHLGTYNWWEGSPSGGSGVVSCDACFVPFRVSSS